MPYKCLHDLKGNMYFTYDGEQWFKTNKHDKTTKMKYPPDINIVVIDTEELK